MKNGPSADPVPKWKGLYGFKGIATDSGFTTNEHLMDKIRTKDELLYNPTSSSATSLNESIVVIMRCTPSATRTATGMTAMTATTTQTADLLTSASARKMAGNLTSSTGHSKSKGC